jgi:hypothetical protein
LPHPVSMVDPTGPLGVLIGLPSLVFTCIQYYDTFESYLHEKKEFASFVPLFGCQHIRFRNWKRQAMPDDITILTEDSTVENLTIASLDQINTAFEDAQNLSERYGMHKLYDWNSRKKELRHEIQDVSRVRKSIWAVEGSRKAKELLDRLKSYNDALDAIWGRSQASVERQLIPELEGFNSIGGLRLIEESLVREEDQQSRDLLAALRLRRICLENIAAKSSQTELVAIKKMNLVPRELRLKAQNFEKEFFQKQPLLSTAVVNNQKVFIEWKAYASEAPQGAKQSEYDKAISDNIWELVQTLAEQSKPWRLRALDCVGFYEVEETSPYRKVCFVFKVPQNSISSPVTLEQLIEQGQRPPKRQFYLGHQFTLASGLAAAVYQVFQAGWVHKGIRSSNIQFYKPIGAADDWKPIPKEFYLMGYEFSRPIDMTSLSTKPQETEDSVLYRHPKYLDSTRVEYHPLFDLYSLGIVLVEIALWKTARRLAIECNHDHTRTEVPLKLWPSVVKKFLIPEVEQKAGLIYAEAVRRCIEGDLGPDSSQLEPREILKRLDKMVVGQLEKCHA